MNKRQRYTTKPMAICALACFFVVLLSSCTPRTPPPLTTQPARLCGTPYPIDAARLARLQQPYQKFGQWFTPLRQAKGFVEEGEAAWYGDNLNGRLTASGERFDKHKMTAAHPGLPMNSCVKVTNLANGYWIILRINDRGPFTGRRIIDVSEAAAKYIGFFAQGSTRVRVEVLP